MDISFMTVLRRFILFISCLISSQISAQAGLAGVEAADSSCARAGLHDSATWGWRKYWCANRR